MLTRRIFEILMNERMQNLEVQQYGTLQEVVHHGHHVNGGLLKLHCESLNVMDDEVDLVCNHLGVGEQQRNKEPRSRALTSQILPQSQVCT